MKETPQNLHWHSRQTISHSYPLTDSEKIELGEVMAGARINLSKLEAELADIKKDFKERMDAENGAIAKLAVMLNSGVGEPVKVDCHVYQDFIKEEMVYVAVETGEEISRRPMLEEEKRPNLISMLGESAKIERFSQE